MTGSELRAKQVKEQEAYQLMLATASKAMRDMEEFILKHGDEILAQYEKGRLGDAVGFEWFTNGKDAHQ